MQCTVHSTLSGTTALLADAAVLKSPVLLHSALFADRLLVNSIVSMVIVRRYRGFHVLVVESVVLLGGG